MQTSRITNDITVYWSNVALSHGANDVVTVAFDAVRMHNISELHTWSACSQTTHIITFAKTAILICNPKQMSYIMHMQ